LKVKAVMLLAWNFDKMGDFRIDIVLIKEQSEDDRKKDYVRSGTKF
jgi:hypothetical protein